MFVSRDIYKFGKRHPRDRVTFEWIENGMIWAQWATTRLEGSRIVPWTNSSCHRAAWPTTDLSLISDDASTVELARSFKADWLLFLAFVNNSSVSSMRLCCAVGWTLSWGAFFPPGFRTGKSCMSRQGHSGAKDAHTCDHQMGKVATHQMGKVATPQLCNVWDIATWLLEFWRTICAYSLWPKWRPRYTLPRLKKIQ